MELIRCEDLKFEIINSKEECPIMHEPIDLVTLGNFPSHYNMQQPLCKGVRLQCGHVFSVAALFYHWIKNKTVLCPLCRQGPKNKEIDIGSLPTHLRVHIDGYICITIESLDKRIIRIHGICQADVFEVEEIDIVQNFFDTLHFYRMSVTWKGVVLPATEYYRFDQTWVTQGALSICVNCMHGYLAAIYVCF